MFGECHGHIILDGENYRQAVALHQENVQENVIRERLQIYAKRGVTFFRDGGDALGVSERAKQLAVEYDVDYRTPVFAIHKKGYYGSIVGKAFEDISEYYALVLEAKKSGADFIKIMTSGILDFSCDGRITGSSLDFCLIEEMIHIAHEEGLAVMSHTNGTESAKVVIAAGADSLEHGNYMDEETLHMLAGSKTVWVPTLVPIRNLIDEGRYDRNVLRKIADDAAENVKKAYQLRVSVALGSDAGAYGVLHGTGIRQEEEAFYEILKDAPRESVQRWLLTGEDMIKTRFRRS